MGKNHSTNLVSCHEKLFSEIYTINTIVQMTKKTCEEYEFSGEYYGLPAEEVYLLSAERNNYINMLNILSERISNIININLILENEITLQQNSNNGCRQVTT